MPFRFTVDGGAPFAFAGLWGWSKPEGEWLASATMLTTQPNPLVARLHDRMPVILPGPDEEAAWLSADLQPEDAVELCRPLDAAPHDLHAGEPEGQSVRATGRGAGVARSTRTFPLNGGTPAARTRRRRKPRRRGATRTRARPRRSGAHDARVAEADGGARLEVAAAADEEGDRVRRLRARTNRGRIRTRRCGRADRPRRAPAAARAPGISTRVPSKPTA